MSYNWKEEHDRIYNRPPESPLMPPGRRATICRGGCMDGRVVYAGIATKFFRKVNTQLGGRQVDSYKLRRSIIHGIDEFVLEGEA